MNPPNLTIHQFQQAVAATRHVADDNPSSSGTVLADIGRDVAELLAEISWDHPQHEPPHIDGIIARRHLSRILSSVAHFANQHGISLDEAAHAAIARVDLELTTHHLFDDNFPESERIPRIMEVSITTDHDGRALTTINGRSFGDPLTDNRYETDDDGYRFHDVFHVANAAILGWSPTLRGLMRRKRKSQPTVDEVEDGGRAIVIEEGITALIFAYAQQRQFLQDALYVDPGVIHTVQEMTAHLEVQARTAADWQQAILQGFRIWRRIRVLQGGSFTANLLARTVEMSA